MSLASYRAAPPRDTVSDPDGAGSLPSILAYLAPGSRGLGNQSSRRRGIIGITEPFHQSRLARPWPTRAASGCAIDTSGPRRASRTYIASVQLRKPTSPGRSLALL